VSPIGQHPPRPRRRRRLSALIAATAALGLTLVGASSATATTGELTDLVETENILTHMERLQTIADFNGDNRAHGTDGYEISMLYVIDQLRQAGYSPQRHEFEFIVPVQHSDSQLTQLTPEQRDFTEGEDFSTFTYSPPGDIEAPVVAVAPDAADSGCLPEHFADFPEGAVALVQRGECFFREKVDNAAEAGASAVLIFNNVPEETIAGTLEEPGSLPALGLTQEAGQRLVADTESDEVTVHLLVDTEFVEETGHNVVAETDGGASDNVVVVGAHLDSVEEGPGINDNGSGSATILEIALQLAELEEPNNAVRFAWWGAEELGLHGSTEYVQGLSDEEIDDIALYLNFDMLASSNYARLIYDGRDELGASVSPIPVGSGAIHTMFDDYFEDADLIAEPTVFSGRSDYREFMEVGIPSGGLFSGADGIKTEEQVEWYGGVAGEPFDFYYHTPEDTFDNVNVDSLDELSGGVAHAVQTYAESTLPVNGRVRTLAEAAAPQWEYRGEQLVR
jgi:Zn-dependent M28 family amino/carboxypeptidase